MNSRVLTVILVIGVIGGLLVWIPTAATYDISRGNQGYEPSQPVAFSHALHAGDLAVPCLYCHWGAQTSRYAGIPPARVCMNCHRIVTARFGAVLVESQTAQKEQRLPRRIVSPELEKVYAALALDENMQRDSSKPLKPIVWNLIYTIPDFVYFDHRAHVGVGVPCQRCHGPVETMERMRQDVTINMGWCVNCHRDANLTGVAGRKVAASTDCSICHH